MFGKFSSHAYYLHMMTALSSRDCRFLSDTSAFLMNAFIKLDCTTESGVALTSFSQTLTTKAPEKPF